MRLCVFAAVFLAQMCCAETPRVAAEEWNEDDKSVVAAVSGREVRVPPPSHPPVAEELAWWSEPVVLHRSEVAAERVSSERSLEFTELKFTGLEVNGRRGERIPDAEDVVDVKKPADKKVAKLEENRYGRVVVART